MSETKGLSKKNRFEVFKRDSFTCQFLNYKSRKRGKIAYHVISVMPFFVTGFSSEN